MFSPLSGTVVVLQSGRNEPTGPVLDESNLYWAEAVNTPVVAGASIVSMPLDGGTVTILATGQSSPAALAVGETGLFWVDQGSASSNGSVMELTPK
jgi:hypothetical protein